ncbi:hypothetical protein [Borrelia sp. HM]|uniref:hypothetical protein n=1 Tax=Borrelia sp. HM TaxID=1882662 RepID=UPI001C74EE12|nr:hypothetical protein [Borrelia sp. HM]BCR22159.1 hypothetical protein BKFM_00753 [Borrelia sp. HM]
MFLTFFYFINKFLNQVEFDLNNLVDDIKSYNINFFRDLNLEYYFEQTLFKDDLVNSYYLLSSVDGILVYKSKDNSIYKLKDKLESTSFKSSGFIKKVKINFELSDDVLISLVIYYNILPKSRILYILFSYLFLMSFFYFCFSIFIIYRIHIDLNGGAHCFLVDDLH